MHNRSMYFVTFIATMNHHNETPLAKSGKVTMKASRLRSLCVQIFKIINSNQHWRIKLFYVQKCQSEIYQFKVFDDQYKLCNYK